MKRYGRRMITLKDMLVEYLMEHMEGRTFEQLRAELSASIGGLTLLLTKMRRDGEILRVTKPLPTMRAVIATCVRERIADVGLRRIIPPVRLTNDVLDRQVDTDKPVKIVDEVFKLSPRMWIEEVTGICRVSGYQS